jgi:hypothetical protein
MYKLVKLLNLNVIDKKQNLDIVAGFVIYPEVPFPAAVMKFPMTEYLSVGMIRNKPAVLDTIEKVFFNHNGAGVIVILFPRTVFFVVNIYSLGNEYSMLIKLLPFTVFDWIQLCSSYHKKMFLVLTEIVTAPHAFFSSGQCATNGMVARCAQALC